MGTARVPLVNEREISSTVHVFRTAHRTVNHTGNCTVSYGVSCALVGVSCVGPAAAGAGGKNRAGAGCPADGGSHRPSFPRTKTLAYAASFAGDSPRPLGCLKLLRSRVLRTRKLLDHVPCSSRQPSGHPPLGGNQPCGAFPPDLPSPQGSERLRRSGPRTLRGTHALCTINVPPRASPAEITLGPYGNAPDLTGRKDALCCVIRRNNRICTGRGP